MHHRTSTEPIGIDPGLSVFQADTSSRPQRRVKKNRPHGLGPVLKAFQNGEPMIYAMRLADGVVKIGCTTDLAHRRSQLDGDLLAFRFGAFEEEAAIHRALAKDVVRGREYYTLTDAVLAFVNELRDDLGLEPIAA